MIILDSTTKSLEIVLNSAITTNQLVVVDSYVDVTTTTYIPGANDTVSNDTTPVTIVAAPSASTQRQVKLITVYNKDTVASIVTIQYNDNTTIRIIVKITLDTGSTLVYTDGEGWRVINSSGAILSSGATGPTGPAGIQGIQGYSSLDGQDGDDSFIPGPRGLTGSTGLTGSPGANGVVSVLLLEGEEPEAPYILPGPIGPAGPQYTKEIPVNLQTGTTYTVLSTDRNNLVSHTNGSAIAVTLPQATGTFAANWFYWTENRGVGTVTITPTISTIDGAATLALTTNQGCLIVSDGTNYYTMRGVSGGGSSAAGLKQVFTGLNVRTSPDNTIALTTVTILSLAQWTANDGTLITESTPLSNNTALITASGAGGLDTGSEAASTWYEIYRIRKSSDGTLNTMFHRALDWTIDTSFTTARDVSLALRLLTGATDKLDQGIKFANSKPFVFFNIELIRAGAVSGNIWYTLESDSAGAPSGVVLATSNKMDASQIATSNQIIEFFFPTPYTVTATTQYHLVLQGDYTRSATVNISWRGIVAGGYIGGSPGMYNGATWSPATGVGDFYFTASCEFNNTALTLPSGYDQYCKLGYVYNNGSSNFAPFNADNNFVKTLDEISVGSITATVGTLTSVILPPQSVIVYFNSSSDTDQMRMRAGGIPDGLGNSVVPTVASGTNTAYLYPLTPFITSFQSAYFQVSSGTGSWAVEAYQW